MKGYIIRYRYATAAIVGPWRRTEEEALEDAVRAGIAATADGRIIWNTGGIERDETSSEVSGLGVFE